jgi:hypothetical protein
MKIGDTVEIFNLSDSYGTGFYIGHTRVGPNPYSFDTRVFSSPIIKRVKSPYPLLGNLLAAFPGYYRFDYHRLETTRMVLFEKVNFKDTEQLYCILEKEEKNLEPARPAVL